MTKKHKLIGAIVAEYLVSELCLSAVGVWCSYSQPFTASGLSQALALLLLLQADSYPQPSARPCLLLRISPSCTFTPNLKSSSKAACPKLVSLLISFSASGFCTHLESTAASVMLPRSQCSAAR